MNLNDVSFFTSEFEQGKEQSIDDDFFKERSYLGGWTVSERHPYKGLKRKQSKDILPSKIINNSKPSDLRNIIEKVILKYATDKNVILLSGGKDSTTLAHIFKKLNIPFIPISLYSTISQFTEQNTVRQIEKELSIEVNYFKVDKIELKDFKYWIENPYTAKRKAIEELGLLDYTIFTGEIGTGEMQIDQSLQYTAMMGYKPHDLSHWHVNVCGSYRRINSVKKLHNCPIYSDCVNYFIKRFDQWNKHPDILNRVMFSRLQDEGAYRIFNNNLDNLNWVHPFADSEFIHTCVNMESTFKGNKNLYRLMYNDLTDIPWRYPKNGLGIPTV